jgi:hypothetical protein
MSQGVTPPQDMIVEGEGGGGGADEPTPPSHGEDNYSNIEIFIYEKI